MGEILQGQGELFGGHGAALTLDDGAEVRAIEHGGDGTGLFCGSFGDMEQYTLLVWGIQDGDESPSGGVLNKAHVEAERKGGVSVSWQDSSDRLKDADAYCERAAVEDWDEEVACVGLVFVCVELGRVGLEVRGADACDGDVAGEGVLGEGV